jgi:hypothetical protein
VTAWIACHGGASSGAGLRRGTESPIQDGRILDGDSIVWYDTVTVTLNAAERKRAQRERARKKGLCIVCCVSKARPGLTTCASCSEEAYARVQHARSRSGKKRRKKT